ncbi:cellulose biosynthesis cyclic di-GMP-binding regulatory protein BcsB [Companilactobacillus hulinensis]|uniref:cellulose biosynthesis cyclic di-GMP-binding regulatory protein BcsB n=1 Tax=Companilactobacillus hulinensis TaxID=2486007 RepID=UPI000F78E945|nr:cellulose biosynthesis cyclic di-GMP-binding regulatory protein BcsB [Companilactobacillus hulinensis]
MLVCFVSVILFAGKTTTTNVSAQDMQTYTQQFQNSTTTLSGRSVESNMYLTKMDYWDVKKVTFNFNFQVSQLASRDISDITVSLNGVKFYSFRPSKKTGMQTKAIDVPVKLLGGSNKLQIEGQILSSDNNNNYQLAQTPANWLTIEKGSNVNFEYDLKDADNTINSFYDHFSGQDTISNARSRIATANDPTPYELTASMIALAGESRIITTTNDQIPVVKMDNMHAADGDYVMVVAKYNHLPDKFKSQVSAEEVNGRAVIKTYYDNGKYYLIVTAKTGALLKKAARFVANAELMKETSQSTEYITDGTATFTSSLHDNGVKTITSSTDMINGAGHRENNYLISLPNDRTNADGSEVYLKFRYSKNLNFNRSLVTVRVNDTTLGSKKLTAAKANGDTLTVKVPRGTNLGNSFTISIAFDLEMKDQNTSDNSQTPWAEIDTESKMYVKSKRSNDLLFTNYPTLFINNQTYDNIAVIAPRQLSNDDFRTLTNVFNLIGNFSKSNTGDIQFYSKMPSKSVLKNRNVIVIGTPKNNSMIKSLNPKLYFKYSKDFSRIVSNEKLSIEHNYGKTIGTAQLLRSPYNDKRGMMVVTGANDNAVYLASTQINFQANIQQYSGDGLVVDPNNTHYGYRFKKNKAIDKSLTTKQLISNNTQLIIYLVLALVVILMIGAAVFLVMRKQGLMSGGHKHGK